MKPKELVIISGKGGTGKTSLTSSLCALAAGKAVFCDADVDAPDLWILLHPDVKRKKKFLGLYAARVNENRCIGCGRCAHFCRFRAISMKDGKAIIDETFCEGCGGCEIICPSKAISLEQLQQGEYYFSETKQGPMWHALLNPGGENSGMLVSHLRKKARETALQKNLPLVIVDGPPGIACPAISSITGSDLAVAITEPTKSGWHDLERIGDLCSRFDLPLSVVINKADLAPDQANELAEKCKIHGWRVLGKIPFRRSVVDAVSQAKIPLEELSPEIKLIWNGIQETLQG